MSEKVLSWKARLLNSIISGINNVLLELQGIRVVDPLNTTTDNLGNGEVFTGEWTEALPYASITVELRTDQASAVNGFQVQSSDDASTIQHSHKHTINANINHHYTYTLSGKYYRIVYTNGVDTTTSLRIGSVLSKVDQSHQHTHGVEFVIDSDHSADLVRNVNVAKTAMGNYVNIGATNGGNLKQSIEEYDDAVNPIRKDMEGLGKIAVGTTADEVEFAGTPTHSVIITADLANTGVLYVGKSDVTDAGANAITFLEASESVTIDYDDSDNAVFVVASIAAQNYFAGTLL
ncbi:hypothetical protein KAR91_04075 [Candidatus Pacearchaeota archaeon]|nr:hypothetical protein [Candidatus Pacearchaeota archaeon]